MENIVAGILRAAKIRNEAERIDPYAGWEKNAHPWIGEGLTERQNEAISQAKFNLKTGEGHD